MFGNLMMKWELMGDQIGTSPFGVEFARKQAQPTIKQKYQIPNQKIALLNLLVMVLHHLCFKEG